ncbi:type II toxin-antitoxin system VapC family toxin [Natronosporangium hydrolyticum]|uniref:Ribonuclease VapC n=1 Tax=Natronosporangium hydrolyticum TaxID=2811111 RepID=A0A895YH09_9ACTN|nr:type II toxin-antitoxin system VapC family toxin [Natronosporangium hydrolyticum]QSB16841.1 type II toxin-antitoxin system VapC family toxin [Natronosporangium hydrolyticum]
MIYLDSAALVKLVHPAPHSNALALWLAERAQQTTLTSALARTETVRALRRSDPPAIPRLPAVFARLLVLPIDNMILDSATALPDPLLRTLDAIHLATALALKVPSISFVTYDKRLLAAATAQGFDAVAPAARS